MVNLNLKQFINREPDPRGSIIWNGILRTKSVDFEKAKWKLGNGEDINFWHDDWLSVGPLWDIEPFNIWENVCIDRLGVRSVTIGTRMSGLIWLRYLWISRNSWILLDISPLLSKKTP